MEKVKSILRRLPWQYLVFALIVASGLRMGELKHVGGRFPHYHAHLVSDMAGYYIYLPASVAGWDARKIAAEAEAQFGFGFELSADGVIRTKYTCGVALMQWPFFEWIRLNHLRTTGAPDTGLESWYQDVPVYAGAFYFFFGLGLLFGTLRQYYSWLTALITVTAIGWGTNLFYFAADHPGMSHVYSFFLFAAALRVYSALLRGDRGRKGLLLLLMFLSAMIMLVRPLNIVFLLVFIFWDLEEPVKERLRYLFTPRKMLAFAGITLLVFLPQFLYWQYASGSPIAWSYTGEGFDNWLLPQVHLVWFSLANGLLPNTPLWLALLLGCGFMAWRGDRRARGLLLLFLLLSYLFGAWHQPLFGCSFGHRCFVEWLAPFSIGLAFLLSRLLSRWHTAALACLALVGCAGLNLKMTWTFEGCWEGDNPWDWKQYQWLTTSKPLWGSESFEQNAPGFERSQAFASDSTFSVPLHSIQQYSPALSWVMQDRRSAQPRRIHLQFDARFSKAESKISLIMENHLPQKDRFWSGTDFVSDRSMVGQWHTFEALVNLPPSLKMDAPFRMMFWHEGADTVYVDHLRYWIH